MPHQEEMMQGLSAIFKFVFENKTVHRNVLRKKLLFKGKVASKEKFSKLLESLVSAGYLIMNKEDVSINPDILNVGVLQQKGDEFYIVAANRKKHVKIDSSLVSNYKVGDVLDIVAHKFGGVKGVVVLGKSQRETSIFGSPKQTKVKAPDLEQENFVLGRVVKLSHDDLVFIPNKKSLPVRQIPILNPREDFPSFQDKICVMNVVNMEAPLLGGYITEIKGDAGNPIHEYDAIAENYGAIMSWQGEEIESEIAQIPSSVDVSKLDLITEQEAKFSQRGKVVDLRHIPFSTVDPATCKDMDDAIYSTINENGDIVCYTAVANVTKYVDLHSEIGRRYINGGFTIYAPNKAYNILPTQLSTGICSLNPHEYRLAFVVKTVIDKSTGKVKNSTIYDAIIQSKHKYSYEQAQEIVDNLEGKGITKFALHEKIANGEELTPEEQVLLNFYAGQTIKVGFEQRKMIRFVANKERDIVFDSDFQNVIDIAAIPHLDYHEIIEAFMVTANEATAKFARDNNLDNIFRVHDEPNPKKVERAGEFFDILGIDFDGDLSAEGTRTLIDLIRNTTNEEVINKFLIKMQSRAVYSEHLYSEKKHDDPAEWMGERISHYALQSPHYSHTTSPIRRVPDYITQYNILAHIHGTKPISARFIEKIVDIANQRQIDVDQAEKDFEDISSVMYCEQHIGERMTGRVTKIRYASVEEGYEDNIVVIVKNEEKGINVEIPLSQILGRSSNDCKISDQRCAVFDKRGNVVLSLCKPIDFVIAKADRKAMIVVGSTNRELVQCAEVRANSGRQAYTREQIAQAGAIHKRHKESRARRFGSKREHQQDFFDGDDQRNL